MTRAYVGPDLDFDIQLVLKGNQVPGSRLAATSEPDDARPRSEYLALLPDDRGRRG